MRTRIVLPILLVATLGACNFNVLVVEVESEEVCVTGLTADIPADAEGTVTVTLSKDGAQDQDSGGAFDIEVPEGWEVTEVTLLGVGIEAKHGIDNLHFVNTVHLDMTGTHPELDLPTIDLLDVDISNLPYNTTSRSSTFLEAAGTFNLVEYLQAEELEFGLSMTGDMPSDDWGIGLDVCFTFVAEYRESI